MADRFRSLDKERLVHYEGVAHDERYPETTDMYSQMYTSAADIEKYLISIAYTSMSRRISAKHRRDFLNDTVDLMHSMGVWVQKGYGKNGQNQVRQFKGGTPERTTSRKPHTERPEDRLQKNIGTVSKIVGTPMPTHWYVCFAATMPYAVRIEYEYKKRVLIGQFHTLMNQFVRDSGMGLNGDGGVKFYKYYYGYIFESTNASQIVEAG
jgi:hypothetical protein